MNWKTTGLVAVSFSSGAAIGFIFAKKKLEKDANAEIEEIRKNYLEKITSTTDENQYERIAYSYSSKSGAVVDQNKIVNESDNKIDISSNSISIVPSVIGAFELDSDYGVETLTYYSDGVLAYDASDEIVAEPEDLVGEESLNRLALEEADVVSVKNDSTKMYYEITASEKTYRDGTGIDI